MRVRSVTMHLLVGVLSVGVLGSLSVGAQAKTTTSYVRIKPASGKLAVYHQVPKTTKQVKKATHKSVSANQVLKVEKRRTGHGGTYLQLRGSHTLGWVKQSATTKLSHVRANGTLTIVKTKAASGNLVAKAGVKTLTIDVNGPQATQPKMQYQTVSATKAKQLKVTKAVWTDFGKYYQLTGQGINGWVKATKVDLQLKLPANADTIITIPKPVNVLVMPAQGFIGGGAAVMTPVVKVPVKQPTPAKVVVPVKKPTVVHKTTTPTTPKQPVVVIPVKPTAPVKKPGTTTATVPNKTTTTTPKTQPTKPVTPVIPATGKLTEAEALSQINNLITQNHIMGTLLVTNNGPAGVKVMNYGYANVAKKIANTTNESYPLASLEKALTGAVVQQLINQGKLSMTTPLSKYYPQVPYASDITVRELLDHTSGIRMGEPVPTTPLTTEAAQVTFTISHLDSTDQHVWSYSNANFTLLSGIIGKVTGKSFMSNLQSDVLKPLGMTHTFLYNQIPSSSVTPSSYSFKANQSQPDNISTNLLSSELGCGNVYASVGDYYTFINSLFTGKLDGKAGFAELSDGLKLKYSGGIYYQADDNVRIGGADNGFHSYYFGTNDGKNAVVLFTNQSSWKGANTVSGEIQQILMSADKF
ncbi:serine hydrolase domain-containing protein [Lactiplantibacillus songbeiensis]|uniref:Serine hydrolase domain-containing protein n=1 Tax=Lactiplantibacillus songbeiensis TaxID=2559920 RepID=A0ABW4C4I2_9LACO|nr:serine hydrolase domain-containing protein [Lactiplantibacillus songbeiensis]